MKKHLYLLTLLAITTSAFSQTVTTYAGKANDDPLVKYEAFPTDVDKDNSYFSLPEGICFDANGKMYIAERNKIRLVHGDKLFIRAGSLASPSSSEGYKNATSTQATFRVPGGMASDDDGNIYICDIENHAIRKLSKFVNTSNNQFITTFAGAAASGSLPGYGVKGSTNGTGTAARFNKPTDICVDGNGNMYVTEYDNFTIRKITPAGVVTTLAGKAETDGFANGTGAAARFGGPWGIAMYDNNSIVVSDPWNSNIRLINIFTGVTTTVAGPTSSASPTIKDGTLTEARFSSPKGLAVIDGIIYVGDKNVIRAIDIPNNSVTTLAGDKTKFGLADGSGTSATFTEISDIVSDGQGNLYVLESSLAVASSVIRKVSIDNLAPNALFTVSSRNVAIDQDVKLTDVSTGQEATSRTWSFNRTTYTIENGDLNSTPLDVKFTATGFYDVSLSITNDYGTDALTETSYISVSTSGSIDRYSATNLVSLYPNPANEIVTIDIDASLQLKSTVVELYNVNGILVKDLGNERTIETASLPSGIYFLTIKGEETNFAKKLVVAH